MKVNIINTITTNKTITLMIVQVFSLMLLEAELHLCKLNSKNKTTVAFKYK